MKKVINKINNSKFLFSIFIISAFVLFDIITTGLNGIIFKYGLTHHIDNLFEQLYNYSYFGRQFVGEFFWFLCIIPVIIIFKNKYIFSEKKESFLSSLKYAWPILILTIFQLILSIRSILDFKINYIELIGLILFTLTIGLFEEFLCRGWIQNEFMERFGKNRKGVIFSIIISGLIFGVMHITNVLIGQSLIDTIAQIISATITGFLLGAIYNKTKNIWSVVFIHAFWDFAIFLSEINTATTCVLPTALETTSIIFAISVLIITIISSLGDLFNALLLLGKEDINTSLPEKQRIKYNDEEIKSSRTFKLIITIILIIYLVLNGIIIGINVINHKKDETCPTYIEKEVESYSEHFINSKNYDINITKEIPTNCINQNMTNCMGNIKITYNYNFKINDKQKLEITNSNTKEKITLDYDNVLNIAIFDNDGTYTIIIAVGEDNGNILAYSSNFITLENITDEKIYLNDIKESFNQILVPSIMDFGYYQEQDNNYKYPLFISDVGDRYIVYPDGTIYTY